MRKLALALVLVLLMGMCSFASADGLEPMKITVASWDLGYVIPEGADPDPVLQYIMDKFNVEFEFLNVGWSDAATQYNTWASSGSMPDVAGACDLVGGGTYFQWINDGVVRALPDDLSAYPNVEKYVSQSDVQAFQVNGQNYFLPRMSYSDPTYWCMDRGLMIRQDWLDNLGLEMPTTGEELLEVMRAFTEDDPDQNGVDDTFGLEATSGVISMYIAPYGFTENIWYKFGDEWKLAAYEPTVIPLADMMRTAYKNGWLDQDFMARQDTQEVFINGRAGILANQVSPKHLNLIKKKWDDVQPDLDFASTVSIVPFTGDDCYLYPQKSYWSETYIGGHVDDATLERILMIMDYLYSDEGMIFTCYGFEGEDYRYDENGNIELTTPLDDYGNHISAASKYPSAGPLSYLAAWVTDILQYEDPNVPLALRTSCKAELARRLAEWKDPQVDWEVVGLDVPEKYEMSSNPYTQWTNIIADTSDIPTEELYEQALAEWNSQGYEACWQAVTAAAAAIGK